MSWQIESGDEGLIRAILSSVRKGAWTHSSVASTPPEFTPVFTNWDLPGGIPTTMYGDADFIATAWPSGWGATLNGAFIYRVAGSDPTLILGRRGRRCETASPPRRQIGGPGGNLGRISSSPIERMESIVGTGIPWFPSGPSPLPRWKTMKQLYGQVRPRTPPTTVRVPSPCT